MLGIDGVKGKLADMTGVWDPYAVKTQTIKTAVEVSQRCGVESKSITSVILWPQASCMLLRIDEIVSGLSHQKKP